MGLTTELKQQLVQYFAYFEHPIVFGLSVDDSEDSQKVTGFVHEIAALTDLISVEERNLAIKPSFSVEQQGQADNRVVFAGIPLGHEFESLVLAMIQASGRPPRVDEAIKERILAIDKELKFETFVTLSCQNCPDVVQALNIMSVLNPKISHTLIEGSMFQAEAEARGVMAVPAVFCNGEEFHSGRANIEQLLELIDGAKVEREIDQTTVYDMLVIGGGPAGSAAAIYAARKGIKVALVAKEFGGQVLDTLSIENFIGIPYIEGPQLMDNMREHVKSYQVEIIEGLDVTGIERKDGLIRLDLEEDYQLTAKTTVVATGANWRLIGIPGELEFRNRGIAYCTHCDGPLFTGKHVTVIGGGNSGVEAALDLAGIASGVTLLEFAPELKADQVLQDRLMELSNVEVIVNADTQAIEGEQEVQSISYKDRVSGEIHHYETSGVFILVGLKPNTTWAQGAIEMNPMGELIVDKYGATSLEGVYGGGDCTDAIFKQIVISLGSGATAALGAYDYLIRNGLLHQS